MLQPTALTFIPIPIPADAQIGLELNDTLACNVLLVTLLLNLFLFSLPTLYSRYLLIRYKIHRLRLILQYFFVFFVVWPLLIKACIYTVALEGKSEGLERIWGIGRSEIKRKRELSSAGKEIILEAEQFEV